MTWTTTADDDDEHRHRDDVTSFLSCDGADTEENKGAAESETAAGAAAEAPSFSAASTRGHRASREAASDTNPFITTLHPHDVVLGRGSGANEQPGNRSFRSRVAQLAPVFVQDDRGRDHKLRVIRRAIRTVTDEGGRFVRKVSYSDAIRAGFAGARADSVYTAASDGKPPEHDPVIVEKTRQTFRYVLQRLEEKMASPAVVALPPGQDGGGTNLALLSSLAAGSEMHLQPQPVLPQPSPQAPQHTLQAQSSASPQAQTHRVLQPNSPAQNAHRPQTALQDQRPSPKAAMPSQPQTPLKRQREECEAEQSQSEEYGVITTNPMGNSSPSSFSSLSSSETATAKRQPRADAPQTQRPAAVVKPETPPPPPFAADLLRLAFQQHAQATPLMPVMMDPRMIPLFQMMSGAMSPAVFPLMMSYMMAMQQQQQQQQAAAVPQAQAQALWAALLAMNPQPHNGPAPATPVSTPTMTSPASTTPVSTVSATPSTPPLPNTMNPQLQQHQRQMHPPDQSTPP